MSFVQVSRSEGVGTISLTRGKLNPLNETLVDELHQCLRDLEEDPKVRAVIVTAQGKFFSFGKESILEFARMWHGDTARKSLGKLTVVRPARG